MSVWIVGASGGGSGVDALPIAGGRMLGAISFGTGGQNINVGSFDNGTGGASGISLVCAVNYELNWQGGRLRCVYNNDTHPIYCESQLNFTNGDQTLSIAYDVITFHDGTQQGSAGIASVTTDIGGASRITNCVSISQSDYDALASKDGSTLYVIT
jgi:hypothetical protein